MEVAEQIARQREDYARARSQIGSAISRLPRITQQQLRQGSASPLMGRLQRRQTKSREEKLRQQEEEILQKQAEFETEVAIKAPQYASPEVVERLSQQAKSSVERELQTLEREKDKARGEDRKKILKKIEVYEQALKLEAPALIQAVQSGQIEKTAKRFSLLKSKPIVREGEIEIGGLGYSVAPELQGEFIKQQTKPKQDIGAELTRAYQAKQVSIDPFVKQDIETRGTVFPRVEYLLEKTLRKLDVPNVNVVVKTPTITQPFPLSVESPLSRALERKRISLNPINPIIKPITPTEISTQSIPNTRSFAFKTLTESRQVAKIKPSTTVGTAIWFVPYVGAVRAGLFGGSYLTKATRAVRAGTPLTSFIKERPLETAGVLLLGGGAVLRGLRSAKGLKAPTSVRIRAGTQGEYIAGIGVIQSRASKLFNKIKLPKLAARYETPFIFAEKEVGKGFDITAVKGLQKIKGEQGLKITEALSKEFKEVPSVRGGITPSVSVSRSSNIYLGSRSGSIRMGDYTLAAGNIFKQTGKKGLRFEAIIKEVPKSFDVSAGGEVLKAGSPLKKIGRVVEEATKISTPEIREFSKIKVSPSIVGSVRKVEVGIPVKTNVEIFPKQREETKMSRIKSDVKTKSDITIRIAEKTRQRERQDELQLQRQIQEQKGRERSLEKVFLGSGVKTRDMLSLKNEVAQIQKPKQRVTTRPFSISLPKTPVTKPFISTAEEGKVFSGENILVKGFDVFVRRGGKWIKISRDALTRAKALKLGAEYTKSTLAATFKITETPRLVAVKGEKYYEPSPEIFRTYKVSKGKRIALQDTFIQKASKRLSSLGEVREIQTFKSRTKKGNRRKMRWL